MSVYKAINAVQADLAKSGIGKDRENSFDKYKFRGIDDVYNALAPLLAKHGLCVLPRILKRESVERESAKGGALFYVTVEAEFDFVCAEDGSKHVVRTFGEAMDRGDKATNKAMSAAYKYAAFQAFAIPTEGDNDADAGSPDPKPGKAIGSGVISGPKIAFDELPPDWKSWITDLAARVENTFEQHGKDAAQALIDDESKANDLDPNHIAALFSKLGSKTRSALTAHIKKAA